MTFAAPNESRSVGLSTNVKLESFRMTREIEIGGEKEREGSAGPARRHEDIQEDHRGGNRSIAHP